MLCQASLIERLLRRVGALLREYRVPLLTAFAVGLLAHGYVFANNLPGADQFTGPFSKGGDFEFGRWFLRVTNLLFPGGSLPWVYGLLSLCFYAAVVCLTIRIFAIRNPFLQGALAAAFLSFPSLTSLYCYFFTCIPYAIALLLAVLAVLIAGERGWPRALLSAALLAMSLGIYQAYIAVASTYFVLLMIRRLLRGEGEARAVFLFGLRALGILGLALLLYFGINRLVLALLNIEMMPYMEESAYSLPYKVALAYNALLKAITRGYFGFAPRPLSRAVHALGALAVLGVFARWFWKNRDLPRGALLALCLLLFPLSMNCIFLIASVEVIHSLALYSFVCVYVLAVIAVETLEGRIGRVGRDLLLTGVGLIAAVNVLFANEVYLKMDMELRSAIATYTEIVTQVKQTPGFDANSRVALIGRLDEALYRPEELDTGDLLGPEPDLVNVYSKEYLIRIYLGFDADFLSRDEDWLLSFDPRVAAMPCYPYYGSVQKVDDVIVVKLGEY